MAKNKVIIGNKYNYLTVLREVEHKQGRGVHKRYLCQCDCGRQAIVQSNHLLSGTIKSCGCLREKHLESDTNLYDVWTNMKQRCCNQKNPVYKDYGGRGIKVCKLWKDNYILFRDWSLANGYKKGLTLDRIDNNGNYAPNNCRWVTMKQQTINRRNTIYVLYENKKIPLRQVADILNYPYKKLYQRVRYKTINLIILER